MVVQLSLSLMVEKGKGKKTPIFLVDVALLAHPGICRSELHSAYTGSRSGYILLPKVTY
jgi:hypothetical protein